ncbi:MAG: hypothetical protein HY736_20690, partial [Verrucomicrobia bacterium]|nr:hypothetical protein [Verrucomicrobiota bacterium]
GWRYIQWSDGRAELYDEVNDPEETRNLAGDSRHAALVKEHQDLLERVGPFTSTDARPPERRKRKE